MLKVNIAAFETKLFLKQILKNIINNKSNNVIYSL